MRAAGWLVMGAGVFALGLGAGCGDDDDDDDDGNGGPVADVSFATEVHPILVTKCGACHGTSFAQANVDAAYTAALGLVNTTTPAQSPLIVNGNGGNAHPDQLTDAEVQTIQTWVTQGAKDN